MKHFFVRLLILSSLSGALLTAQVQTGTPPFASYGGGPFDTINLGNLNVHFTVPILHKAGRGTAFTYDMSYDNSIWYPATLDGLLQWVPVSNWGWRGVTEVATGFVNYQVDTTNVGGCEKDIHTFIYHDQVGISHVFSPKITKYIGHGCAAGTTLPITIYTYDSSGYSLYLTSLSTGTLTARSGDVTNPPFLTGAGPGNYTDDNGNELTVDTSGHFFDTLSAATPALTVAGTPPTSTTFVYPGPSGSATYTMAYTPTTVTTSFGCTPFIHEYSGSVNLVTRITLADLSYYSFSYYADGRLKVVTLPTGGTITYAYTGSNNGINCADGSTLGMTRTLSPGGEWIYARSDISGRHWQTTVTSPHDPTVGNVTQIDFQQDSVVAPVPSNFYETQRLMYQGGISPTNLLATTIKCYNGVNVGTPSSCPTTGVTVGSYISRVTKFNYLPDASGPEAETDLDYESHGLVTDEYDYDYGSAVVGPLLRHVNTMYNTTLTNGIYNRPAVVTIKDVAGTTVAKTSYTYDEDLPLPPSGATQLTTITGSRGNLTTIASQANGTTTLYRKFTHWDTGTVIKSGGLSTTNAMANWTTYTYGATGSCNYAFATAIAEPISLGRSATWNCAGGLPATTTDENSKITTYSYDSMWRNTNITHPDMGQLATAYAISAGSPNIQVNRLITTGQWIDTQTNLDGLGRTLNFQSLSDPNGTATTDTTYDALGRLASVSHPYYLSSDPTSGITTYSHDALGRTTMITNPDSTTKAFSFVGHAVKVTDESTHQKVLQSDALGRLAYVCDGIGATGLANGATPGDCTLDITASGFRADYTYDPLANLTRVSYSGQVRTFTYDELSRMTSEVNPESGTLTATYDTGTAGDLYQRTFPKPNASSGTVTATYAWDLLHRPTSVAFSDSSPGYYYFYDATSEWSTSLANTKGRLSEQEHGAGGNLGSIYSYDSMGRIVDNWQHQPDDGGTAKHLGYTYNLLGEVVTTADAGGGYTFTNTYNAIGQFTGEISTLVGTNYPRNLYSGATYNALGELVTGTYGDGLTRSNTYNHMGRLTQILDGPTATPAYFLNLGYTNNGSVSSYNDSVAGNWSFTYDVFNRLWTSSNSTSGAAYSYNYDQFGNRWTQQHTAGTGLDVLYSFNGSNRNTTSGFAYDVAGNLTSDGSCTPCWTYDDAGNVATGNGATFTYDGVGQRVQKIIGSTTQDFIVGLDGKPFDEYQGTTHYRTTGSLFTYANSDTYFNRPDHEGTPRVTTDHAGNTKRTATNLPFGDGFSESSFTPSIIDFNGYADGFWDSENNADHFGAREYAKTQGRWLSPDPAGLAAVNLSNPQTLNRYAYVANNPMSYVDPSGFNQKGPGGGECNPDEYNCLGGAGTGDSGSGGSDGGAWLVTGIWGNGGTDDDRSQDSVIVGWNYTYFSPGGAGGAGNPDDPTGGGDDSCSAPGAGTAQGSIHSMLEPKKGKQCGSPKNLIEQANEAFRNCVSSGALAGAGVGAVETIFDASKSKEAPTTLDTIVNITNASLDVQSDCLRENPLADLSPNYQGLYTYGDTKVLPIIGGVFPW